MCYQECVDLANEKPELKEIIKKIDHILKQSTSGIIEPDIIADIVDENEVDVSGILYLLEKKDLLYKEKFVECPHCKNLMEQEGYSKSIINEDIFECSNCQLDLIENFPKKTEKYRLNLHKSHEKTKNEDTMKTLQIKSEDFDENFIEGLIDDPFASVELLQYYSRVKEWQKIKPFNGIKIFFVLHFLKDLIPFVKACESLGLDLKNAYFFYKEYPYPQRKAIKKWLIDEGAIVLKRSKIESVLKEILENSPEDFDKIIIIEDGGFFAPSIHEKYVELLPSVIGVVEQTTRGIYNDKEIKKIKFPIISVAESKLKGQFEPPYIAEAVVDNIKRLLPNISLKGKNVALFGCGTIGQKLAEWLRKNRMIVEICEIDAENRLWATENGFKVNNSPEDVVKNKDFVIGTSGRQSINSSVISNLEHGTYLVSASSELYEIDMEELIQREKEEIPLTNVNGKNIGTTFVLTKKRKKIHVLANGYPINFWGFNSMPDEASDLILCLIFLSTVELALGNYTDCVINYEAVNEIAKKHKVAEKFLDSIQT